MYIVFVNIYIFLNFYLSKSKTELVMFRPSGATFFFSIKQLDDKHDAALRLILFEMSTGTKQTLQSQKHVY